MVQVARCESSATAARQVLRAARDELGLAAAKAFARIDQDGSGTLDKGELKELCRELGIGEAQTLGSVVAETVVPQVERCESRRTLFQCCGQMQGPAMRRMARAGVLPRR